MKTTYKEHVAQYENHTPEPTLIDVVMDVTGGVGTYSHRIKVWDMGNSEYHMVEYLKETQLKKNPDHFFPCDDVKIINVWKVVECDNPSQFGIPDRWEKIEHLCSEEHRSNMLPEEAKERYPNSYESDKILFSKRPEIRLP